MKYTAEYIKYDRHYHHPVGRIKREFPTVQAALKYSYKHGMIGYDLLIEEVTLTDTGEVVKVWEHTTPQSQDVEI